MALLVVTTRDGEVHRLNPTLGQSVMQAIRDGGIDEIRALCGGACACATCHVYVDAAFADRLGAPAPDEIDLLDSSSYRTKASRLACQLALSNELDGLAVAIAPEE